MTVCQFANGSLELREIKFLAKHVKEIELPVLDTPCRANAKIGELSVLVCGVPTLQHLVETARLSGRIVEPQPFPFDNNAGLRLRILLILRHEIVVIHSAALD